MANTENLNLTAKTRTVGKHHSRGLRKGMEVPAVVYGPKVKNVSLSLRENELVKYLPSKYDNAIFTLESDEKSLSGLKVLKKEVTIHPVSRRPVHVDLFAIDMTQTIRVWVEVKFNGKAEGLKEGGVLNVVTREVEVECLPNQIPESIAIDVTPLNVGESFHVSDLRLPEGVEMLSSTDETLCTVAVVEEEKATPVVAAPVEGAAAAAPAEGAAAAAPAAEKKEETKK